MIVIPADRAFLKGNEGNRIDVGPLDQVHDRASVVPMINLSSNYLHTDWLCNSANARRRNRNNEFPALVPVGLVVPHDLVRKIPGQEKRIIRFVFEKLTIRMDGDHRS